MPATVRINYLYFGVLFVILSLIHCIHAGVIEQGSAMLKAAFIFYSLSQSFLEVMLFALIGAWMGKRSKISQWLFVGFTLVVVILHLVDFPLVRIMDLSVWESVWLVLGETLNNFIEMLYATHVTMATWIFALLGLAALFFIGLFGYYLSDKRSIQVRKSLFTKVFVMLPLLMLAGDFLLIPQATFANWRAYEKALPWKRTLLSIGEPTFSVGAPLKPMRSEKEVVEMVEQIPIATTVRPDLFLFIVESLRSDYVNEVVAPHFSAFAKEATTAKQNISSANGTQLSWFSAFFGKFPFYFASFHEKKWQSGSPALCLLKKMGYEIEIFSAVRLAYYKMDQLIFGSDLQLADGLHLYPPDDLIPAHESDRKTMNRLVERVVEQDKHKPRCYIVFLESTHHDYSWPLEKSAFNPYTNHVNYLGLSVSKDDLQSVQNRYRNAIHYLDELFGDFVSELKMSGKWDDAVVVVTGDHGEEFYEGGHLFHASSLNSEQTRVPLLFKLGSRPKGGEALMGSHIDLFPTLFHYLLGNENLNDLFDGQSILSAKKWPYTVTGRYNGSRSPYEFCIENSREKLIAQFTQRGALFKEQELRIMEVRTSSDIPLGISMEDIQHEFNPALHHLFPQ